MLILLAVGLAIVAMIVLLYMGTWSTYQTGVGVAQVQPVAFSHKHHVNGLGLDCRYCHTGVEESSFAGMPPTKTCMTCHSQIFNNSTALEPVRRSFKEKTPLHWRQVQMLPDFVYFDHSIHVNRGVACATCHGEVQKMAFTYEVKAFHMKECLECHHSPMRYLAGAREATSGPYPVTDVTAKLTSCSTCHR